MDLQDRVEQTREEAGSRQVDRVRDLEHRIEDLEEWLDELAGDVADRREQK